MCAAAPSVAVTSKVRELAAAMRRSPNDSFNTAQPRIAANGLPAAFQLAARPFAEDVLLRAARAYERETEWTKRAPAL